MCVCVGWLVVWLVCVCVCSCVCVCFCVVCVCGVCVCVCVCWGTLKKRGKTRMWIPTRLRVYMQNVPVYAGTTRTCVSTCARGAGTHGDVLNPHTGAGGHRQFCLPRKAHVEFSLGPRQRFNKETLQSYTFSSLRIDREQHVPDSSNHWPCLTKLFSFSNLEGNFDGNPQPFGSISLSPSPPPCLLHHHNNTTTTTTTTHDTQHTTHNTQHTQTQTQTQRHTQHTTHTDRQRHRHRE